MFDDSEEEDNYTEVVSYGYGPTSSISRPRTLPPDNDQPRNVRFATDPKDRDLVQDRYRTYMKKFYEGKPAPPYLNDVSASKARVIAFDSKNKSNFVIGENQPKVNVRRSSESPLSEEELFNNKRHSPRGSPRGSPRLDPASPQRSATPSAPFYFKTVKDKISSPKSQNSDLIRKILDGNASRSQSPNQKSQSSATGNKHLEMPSASDPKYGGNASPNARITMLDTDEDSLRTPSASTVDTAIRNRPGVLESIGNYFKELNTRRKIERLRRADLNRGYIDDDDYYSNVSALERPANMSRRSRRSALRARPSALPPGYIGWNANIGNFVDDVAFRFPNLRVVTDPIQSVSRSQYSFLSTPLLILEIVLAMVMFYYVMLICELVVRIVKIICSPAIFLLQIFMAIFSRDR